MILNPQLSFNAHINCICKNLEQKTGLYMKISPVLWQCSEMLVHNTIIAPYFHYCESLILVSSRENIHRILQNKRMRVILIYTIYTPRNARL